MPTKFVPRRYSSGSINMMQERPVEPGADKRNAKKGKNRFGPSNVLKNARNAIESGIENRKEIKRQKAILKTKDQLTDSIDDNKEKDKKSRKIEKKKDPKVNLNKEIKQFDKAQKKLKKKQSKDPTRIAL